MVWGWSEWCGVECGVTCEGVKVQFFHRRGKVFDRVVSEM